ncbi:magnesium transporter MgtE N-terminal domain-containing protein [Jatrophihabitans sp.]|uniref:magnesium transporter MgtE N-terminal domain-containing protein n=1 Tax=Jatrophihabitans sp. TaxID=1932789 RepID=UPI002CD1A11E|nr:CBS domain-containing protein [Jatrophihabitans sp.]
MSTATRVFLARLAGLGVFDPNGDQLGRVRDAVATLRVGRQPPRVLGLVVEVQHRRRIFVPMGRVTRIEPEAVVLTTGSVNIKRFEQRPNELLVLGEVLDRTVVRIEDGARMVVVDAAMEQSRTKDWVITKLAVRPVTGKLSRRRGTLQQLDWNDVDGLSATETGQGADSLLAVLAGLRPADVAAQLQDMPDKRQQEVAEALDDERLADVMEELPEEDQINILTGLPDERAADVLERMNDDDAADLLRELPADEQERLLEIMEPEEAAPVRRLMTYGEYTAGGMMTSEPVILLPDATVAEALARLRNPDLSPALAAQVYVVRPPQATPTGRYLGMAHFQRLLREPPSTLVSGAIDADIDPVNPEATLQQVTRHLATYNLVAVPVVDDNDRLLGAVSVDDVIDHLLPEDWRDRDELPADAAVTRRRAQ